MIFKDYPKITYTLGNRQVTLVDIFRHVAFSNVESSKAFDDYYIQDGETPEIVSAKFYGTSSLSWLILLINNISNIKTEWFLSQQEYLNQNEVNYGGDAFYISALPDLKPGDIIVKVTATASDGASAINNGVYRHVADYDPYFRKIRGICGSGTFTKGDNILFARQNTENGTVTPLTFYATDATTQTNYTSALLVEPYGSSVLYFYNGTNVVIDPYRTRPSGITSINSDTVYLNTTDNLTENNFAYSILYRYGLCGGTAPYSLLKKTVDSDQYAKYIKKQKIKILKSEFVGSVISAIENALISDTIGKNFKIEL